jgi:hypothetical protein
MPWAVTLPDDSIHRTDHLEVGAVIDIAKQCDTTWVHVTDYTVAGDGSVMLAVYRHMCAAAGCDVPDDLTMAHLAEVFNTPGDEASDAGEVEDDLPTEFDQGTPQPGDAPVTT